MTKVVNCRFREAGKVYRFRCDGLSLKIGDKVMVNTNLGEDMAHVIESPYVIPEGHEGDALIPVLRVATPQEVKIYEEKLVKEADAFVKCNEFIDELGLEMNLCDTVFAFDGKKVVFYFTADNRVDFRELVKLLAAAFRVRIELRQIGSRDEAKLVGGIGICGRPLCCNTYMADFQPVSIKMAKEQNLSLNATKISGVCGRLMCCLKNEQETYEELNRNLPNVGDEVTINAENRKGQVQSVNVLRQLVKVIVEENDEKELREYKPEELTFKRRRPKKIELTEEEKRELEGMEN